MMRKNCPKYLPFLFCHLADIPTQKTISTCNEQFFHFLCLDFFLSPLTNCHIFSCCYTNLVPTIHPRTAVHEIKSSPIFTPPLLVTLLFKMRHSQLLQCLPLNI